MLEPLSMLVFLVFSLILAVALQSAAPVSSAAVIVELHRQCLLACPEVVHAQFITAVACGEAIHSTPEVAFSKSSFEKTGLIHLLVVSGCYLFCLEQIMVNLARIFRRSWMRHAFVFSGLGFFVLMTGAAPPALRALFGRCVRGLARQLHLNWTPVQSLTISSFLTLPFCSTKWQMGALALGWIAALGFGFARTPQDKKTQTNHHLIARCKVLLRANAYVYLALIPPLLPFGVPSAVSILCNAVLGTAMALILFPASLSAFACEALAHLADRLWGFSLDIVTFVAKLTPETWDAISFPLLALVPYIFVLTMGLVWRERRLRKRTARGLILALIFFAPFARADELIVWNIGQGSWATLKSPGLCQHFDIGGEWVPRAAILQACAASKNEVFYSHWDWDHIGLTKTALQLFPDLCVQASPGGPAPNAFKAQLLERLPKCRDLARPREIFLSRATPSQLQKLHDTNDFSQVFVEDRVIFPGDSPRKEEKIWSRQSEVRPARILIAGHHGSRSATSQELLERAPNLKMIVASAHQIRYGHPHREMLNRAQEFLIPVLRTEDWGSLHFDLGLMKETYRRRAATGEAFMNGISNAGTAGISVPSSRRR